MMICQGGINHEHHVISGGEFTSIDGNTITAVGLGSTVIDVSGTQINISVVPPPTYEVMIRYVWYHQNTGNIQSVQIRNAYLSMTNGMVSGWKGSPPSAVGAGGWHIDYAYYDSTSKKYFIGKFKSFVAKIGSVTIAETPTPTMDALMEMINNISYPSGDVSVECSYNGSYQSSTATAGNRVLYFPDPWVNPYNIQ